MKPYTACLLTKGQIAFYDLEDAEKVEKFKWHAKWNPHTKSFYAMASAGDTTIYMARVILGLQKGDRRKTDHINHDTLDNRKQNLRIVTESQNQQNRRGVKGYCWRPRMKRWEALIKVSRKLISLGCFLTEEEARQAYLDGRQKYFA